jgi:hypothetical protein
MIRDIQQYESAYLSDYGFERVMVKYRRRLVLERLHKVRPRVVVEVGCGSESLYGHYLEQEKPVECWLIVEPAQQFFEAASKLELPNAHVIHGLLEESVAQILQQLPGAPDLVICSCLLHEVPAANALLVAVTKIMSGTSLLHINVPSATSFHRRLAKAMGLIQDLRSMSARNQQLLQHRVYDMDVLVADLASAGLAVTESGGYFVKPFTHAQMESVVASVGANVLDGLYQLGKELPELASEIYAEARLA